MKPRLVKMLILLLIGIAVLGFAFKQQLYDFFISPDGLSIAASEICMKNETGSDLIVEVDTFVGAKVETLLFATEQVCAPSPNEQLVGKIKVGLADTMAFSCEFDVEKAGLISLVNIEPNGKCEWHR